MSLVLPRVRPPFITEVSRHIWNTRYRFVSDRSRAESSIQDSWCRIARAISAVEPREQKVWEQRFLAFLANFSFLPAGRIQAGAGTRRNVTLFNCFVMGPVEDSMEGIFRALHESAVTMQQGGGIGCDYSTLRPWNARKRCGRHRIRAGLVHGHLGRDV